MEKKKRVIACIFMAIVIAGVWFFLYMEDKGSKRFESVLEKYETLGKVVYIRVSNGERTEVLIWDGKFWKWEDRPGLGAPQDEVSQLLDKVTKELNLRKVEEELSPEETGLDEVGYEVTLKDIRGNELVIHIGKSTPSGAYYATLDGEKQVYTIRRHARKLADEIIVYRMMMDFDINSSPSLLP